MDRPYFDATIKELERLLTKHKSQRVVLAQLREELALRESPRAKQLHREVDGLLNGSLPPSQKTTRSTKPEDQLALINELAGSEQLAAGKSHVNEAVWLQWMSGESEGYSDVLLLDQFSIDQGSAELVHDVVGPRGGVHHARYLLTVNGRIGLLDYEAFPDFNTQNGMLLGRMELGFSDDTRRRVTRVLWYKEKDKRGSKADVAIKYALWEDPRGSAPTTGVPSVSVRQNRIAAAQFQITIERVYRYRCALTNCPVPIALEAAHIDPYTGPESNRRSNGILLRRDLHALFDRGQLAFQPESLVCHFAPDALHWGEYKRLHKTARLTCPPLKTDSPDRKALGRRWKAFCGS